MIRFSCPTCHREYVLADAMFGLPLVCKKCGLHLTVPEPEPEPETPAAVPEPAVTPAPPVSPGPPVAYAPGAPDPTPAVAHSDVPAPAIVSAETWAKLDAPPPPAAPEPKSWGAPAPTPAAAPASRKPLAVVVDVAVVLVLLAVGALLGEVIARKSTPEVLQGLAAPKFPPVDLLLWLAGPVVLVLGYALLGARGKSLGGWLRRRGG